MTVAGIDALASVVVSVLAPYLTQVVTNAAGDLAHAAGGKIVALYQTVKARFQGNTVATEALTDLETQPDDADTQAALRRQLKKQMENDTTFVDELQKLVTDVEQDDQSVAFLTNVYGGEVGKIINIGNVTGGDVHID